MLNFKRSLVIIVGLLCAICVTACGGAAKPNGGVASQGEANNSMATVVPTAQPQSTANALKVQSQSQTQSAAQTPTANTDTQQTTQQTTQNTTNNTQNTTSTTQTTQSNVPANTQGGQNDSNMSNTPPPAGSSGTVIASMQLNVNGQTTDVLTTGTGLTLYYRNTDPAPGSTCTGQCAQAWPPFIAKGTLIPATNFQGQLTVHTTVNGDQVEYNGHPLYTYSGDNSKGQLNGQGAENGIWNAVTVIAQKQHW